MILLNKIMWLLLFGSGPALPILCPDIFSCSGHYHFCPGPNLAAIQSCSGRHYVFCPFSLSRALATLIITYCIPQPNPYHGLGWTAGKHYRIRSYTSGCAGCCCCTTHSQVVQEHCYLLDPCYKYNTDR